MARYAVLQRALLARLPSLRALPWRPLAGVVLICLTIVLGARALILAHDAAAGDQSDAAPVVGHIAPDATFVDLRNHPLPLSSLRGHVVVLNFWYASCPPCQSEMPALQHIYQTDASRGLVVLGVDISDDVPTISAFIQRLAITYPIVRDVDARGVVRYGLYATPATFVIDRQGIIREKIEGPVEAQALAREVDSLLGQRS